MNIKQYKEGKTYQHGDIVAGMPNHAYHQHPGISNSGLKRIEQSPAHYYNAEPSKPTRNMEIGTAIHTAILEPVRFAEEYILLPEVQDRRKPEYKSAVSAKGSSEFVLVGEEVRRVGGMAMSIHSNQYINKRINAPGWNELSFFANDPETDQLCKCRFDYLSEELEAIDLKKTQDARADAFSKTIYNYAYHQQDAFYRDVFKWCTGKELKSFEFLAIEEKLPHGRKMYELDHESIELGRANYRANLDTYHECKTTNNWPLYEAESTELISLPYWVFSRVEDDIIDGLE